MTIFLLLSLVLVLSTESMADPAVSYNELWYNELWYNELRLALQWPNSYCSTGNIRCKHIPTEFTVHGLWHNINSCPVNCPTRNPLPKHINEQMIRKLNHFHNDWVKHWPNLNSQSYEEYLWDHEYEQHGYCFTQFRPPVVYFQTALEIYFQTAPDIQTHIRNFTPQISLSGLSLYNVEGFRQVTIAGRILILGLRCNYARNSKIPQLLEIVFCTHTNKTLKNCSDYVDKCNDSWWEWEWEWDRRGRRRLRKVFRSGWFLVPKGPAPLSGSSPSPPVPDPVPDPVRCNSPHKIFWRNSTKS